MSYEVQVKGGESEQVESADAYGQEGALTTFFQTRDGRGVIDSRARRVASYRTADIVRIRLTGLDQPAPSCLVSELTLRAG